MLIHHCPDCLKHFLSLHLRKKDREVDKNLEFVSIYPNGFKDTFHKFIEGLSPRFVDVYNQALVAEQQNHYEVAGAGYRLAIEILVKDFAINHLGEPAKEVEKKKLATALKDYMPNQDALTSGDVIRHLGNDYAHYVQKYEDVEFQQLKWFLDVFIREIERILILAKPPVPTREFEN